MKPRTEHVSDASLCRAHGWKVGTVLRCENVRHGAAHGLVKRGRITAIGVESILVILIDKRGRDGHEVRWSRQFHSYQISRDEK